MLGYEFKSDRGGIEMFDEDLNGILAVGFKSDRGGIEIRIGCT